MMLVRPEDWRPQGVDDLEPPAWQALRETAQNILVTASAGAGKTEFLAQKATYYLQTGLCPAPKRILAISFKRDAARNLAARVEERCPPEQARRFDSMTFDAFTKNFLDRFRPSVPAPFTPPFNYRIYFPRRQDHEDFLTRYGFHGLPVNQFEKAIARTRLPLGNNPNGLTGARAVETYWREQYNNFDEVLLSFSMINRLVEWLIRENSSICRALQVTYPVVFLDEFQDTTFAQFELLQIAFQGSNAVFTAVGDNKQQIMVWAGAMPDAFLRFEQEFNSRHISLISNWRSHEDLVRIQHVVASRIDPTSEYPEAQADREVEGNIAAIWEFPTNIEESMNLARWIAHEVQSRNVEPHEVAILVRMHADNVEERLTPAFENYGLRLRNVARNVGDISVQDLLEEDISRIMLPLLRLGAKGKSPEDWNATQKNIQFLEAIDPIDEMAQQELNVRIQEFVRQLRRTMKELHTNPDSASTIAGMILEFIGRLHLQQAFPAYRRAKDFDRVWEGFLELLRECTNHANDWSKILDDFEGVGQVALMTIHKSKGLEFHTMIFYGLDNQTWWSLTPNRIEELKSFFVAFTRAKQRAFFTLCSERGSSISWIEQLLKPAGVSRIDGTTLVSD